MGCSFIKPARITMADSNGKSPALYHEHQSWQFCALHTLNNLLQCRAFTKQDLDRICEELSPNQFVNPHRSFFSTGNYDVNVITCALHKKGYELIWFKKNRKLDSLNLDKVFGFVVNIAAHLDLGLFKMPAPFEGRHWYALRSFETAKTDDTKATCADETSSAGGQQSCESASGEERAKSDSTGNQWFNLDSKLRSPKRIGCDSEVRLFIENVLANERNAQVLIVVTQSVAEDQCWHNEAYEAS